MKKRKEKRSESSMSTPSIMSPGSESVGGATYQHWNWGTLYFQRNSWQRAGYGLDRGVQEGGTVLLNWSTGEVPFLPSAEWLFLPHPAAIQAKGELCWAGHLHTWSWAWSGALSIGSQWTQSLGFLGAGWRPQQVGANSNKSLECQTGLICLFI